MQNLIEFSADELYEEFKKIPSVRTSYLWDMKKYIKEVYPNRKIVKETFVLLINKLVDECYYIMNSKGEIVIDHDINFPHEIIYKARYRIIQKNMKL